MGNEALVTEGNVTYPNMGITSVEGMDMSNANEDMQQRKGMDKEKLMRLIDEVHQQYGDALKRLAE